MSNWRKYEYGGGTNIYSIQNSLTEGQAPGTKLNKYFIRDIDKGNIGMKGRVVVNFTREFEWAMGCPDETHVWVRL